MSIAFPGESAEYRAARDRLLDNLTRDNACSPAAERPMR